MFVHSSSITTTICSFLLYLRPLSLFHLLRCLECACFETVRWSVLQFRAVHGSTITYACVCAAHDPWTSLTPHIRIFADSVHGVCTLVVGARARARVLVFQSEGSKGGTRDIKDVIYLCPLQKKLTNQHTKNFFHNNKYNLQSAHPCLPPDSHHSWLGCQQASFTMPLACAATQNSSASAIRVKSFTETEKVAFHTHA